MDLEMLIEAILQRLADHHLRFDFGLLRLGHPSLRSPSSCSKTCLPSRMKEDTKPKVSQAEATVESTSHPAIGLIMHHCLRNWKQSDSVQQWMPRTL